AERVDATGRERIPRAPGRRGGVPVARMRLTLIALTMLCTAPLSAQVIRPDHATFTATGKLMSSRGAATPVVKLDVDRTAARTRQREVVAWRGGAGLEARRGPNRRPHPGRPDRWRHRPPALRCAPQRRGRG